jgi:hypothetical protein
VFSYFSSFLLLSCHELSVPLSFCHRLRLLLVETIRWMIRQGFIFRVGFPCCCCCFAASCPPLLLLPLEAKSRTMWKISFDTHRGKRQFLCQSLCRHHNGKLSSVDVCVTVQKRLLSFPPFDGGAAAATNLTHTSLPSPKKKEKCNFVEEENNEKNKQHGESRRKCGASCKGNYSRQKLEPHGRINSTRDGKAKANKKKNRFVARYSIIFAVKGVNIGQQKRNQRREGLKTFEFSQPDLSRESVVGWAQSY